MVLSASSAIIVTAAAACKEASPTGADCALGTGSLFSVENTSVGVGNVVPEIAYQIQHNKMSLPTKDSQGSNLPQPEGWRSMTQFYTCHLTLIGAVEFGRNNKHSQTKKF